MQQLQKTNSSATQGITIMTSCSYTKIWTNAHAGQAITKRGCWAKNQGKVTVSIVTLTCFLYTFVTALIFLKIALNWGAKSNLTTLWEKLWGETVPLASRSDGHVLEQSWKGREGKGSPRRHPSLEAFWDHPTPRSLESFCYFQSTGSKLQGWKFSRFRCLVSLSIWRIHCWERGKLRVKLNKQHDKLEVCSRDRESM